MNKVYKIGIVAVLLLMAFLYTQPIVQCSPEFTYYVRVAVILTREEVQEISLGSGEIKEFTPMPSPKGYKLMYLEIASDGEFPENIVPISFDKKIESPNGIEAVISTGRTIKLINQAEDTVRFTATISHVYVKEYKLPIVDNKIEVTIENPPEPFTVDDVEFKVSVDNYLPVGIIGVIDPSGRDLFDPTVQVSLPTDAINFDPHHVRVKLGGDLSTGTYTIVFDISDDYVLPCSYLVLQREFLNTTIPPKSTKTLSYGDSSARLIGYAVVLYGLAPSGKTQGEVLIEGAPVDRVYDRSENIKIEGVSYLVPPIEFRLWVRAFVVFGKEFTVINSMNQPISMIYVPLAIREVGVWSENGLTITITEDDVSGSEYAYLVVQTPFYGIIEDVVTPGGASMSGYLNSRIIWGGQEARSLSIKWDEMYIQVKSGSLMDTGVYKIKIKWKEFKLCVVDANGKPIANARVMLNGTTKTYVTDNEGMVTIKPYMPGIHIVKVVFRGTEVFSCYLSELSEDEVNEVKCEVYMLAVSAVSVLNSPIPHATVEILRSPGDEVVYKCETNEQGTIVIDQLPKGIYDIRVAYKRLESVERNFALEKNDELRVTLGMLFELPFLGIPITTTEGALIGGVAAAAVAFKLWRGRSKEEFEGATIEDVEG
ncbi:MAG: hypothetical protein DRJ49_03005 [Thermoprotei archaeon]|nr:MAG: hypothetical protein DRJ49_03005 [Thermoprotei archaeon]